MIYTPTPWKVTYGNWLLRDLNDEKIFPFDRKIRKANASFIVKAVNAHKALLALVHEVSNFKLLATKLDDLREEAREVIALAEASL